MNPPACEWLGVCVQVSGCDFHRVCFQLFLRDSLLKHAVMANGSGNVKALFGRSRSLMLHCLFDQNSDLELQDGLSFPCGHLLNWLGSSIDVAPFEQGQTDARECNGPRDEDCGARSSGQQMLRGEAHH